MKKSNVNGMTGSMVLAPHHVEEEKEITPESKEVLVNMLVPIAQRWNSLPKAAALKNVQVRNRNFSFSVSEIKDMFHPTVNTHSNIITVNCTWDTWHVGICSVTCGEGTRKNHRTKQQVQLYGGLDCVGEANVTEPCNEATCSS